MGAALSAADRRTPAWRPSPRPGSATHASTGAIALCVYYPIALYVYYLIVSRRDPVPPVCKGGPRTSPQTASLAYFRLSEIVKIARNVIFRRLDILGLQV
jgi:hypothetical protein